ncbi:hypothetical protein ACFL59_06465 [Planctomycetota bacterium]
MAHLKRMAARTTAAGGLLTTATATGTIASDTLGLEHAPLTPEQSGEVEALKEATDSR